MDREILEIASVEGFLGGSTASVLMVTERKDGSISIRPGTISAEHCQERRYWERGVNGIRTTERLREVLPNVSTQLGGNEKVAREKLKSLGIDWENPILANL